MHTHAHHTQIIRLGTAEEDFSFHLEQENLDLVMDKVSGRTDESIH
jgi:hypothetical protein